MITCQEKRVAMYKISLTDGDSLPLNGDWLPLTSGWEGTGAEMIFEDRAPAPQKFYRVKVRQP